MNKFLSYLRLVDRIYLLLFIIYLFAYWPILINLGIFWDDWTLVNVNTAAVIDEFRQAGVPLWGYIHGHVLSNSAGIYIYRFLIFILYFLSAVFLYRILGTIKNINSSARFFITLFFMLFPVNFARIALIDFPYTCSYFAFFCGLFLVSIFIQSKTKIAFLYRIFALLMLFLSFIMNSLLVFYLIVIVYIFYHSYNKNINFISNITGLLKYLDFILLPIFFWIVKSSFFQPYNFYNNYNNISFINLIIVSNYYYVMQSSFISVIGSACMFFIKNIIIVLPLGIILFLCINKNQIKDTNDQSLKNNFRMIVVGLILFILAIVPYIAVGSLPTAIEWGNRHQILVPLGASFMIYFGAEIIFIFIKKYLNCANIEKYKIVFFSLIVAIFILINANCYLSFQKDWFKQLSLINNFRSEEIVKNNTSFLINDNAKDYNAIGRRYRYYEYSGIFKKTFDNERRFGVLENEYIGIEPYKIYINYPVYNMSEFDGSPPKYKITINETEENTTNIDIIAYTLFQATNKSLFEDKISKLINIRLEEIKK